MLRKWMVFALSAAFLVAIAGVGFSLADDDSPLEKVMEKVQKHNNAIKKATRTAVAYKKAHKEVAKHAKELVKLAKESKPMKEAIGKAKNEANPQKKWDELMDAFIAKSESLSESAGKGSPELDDVKKHFSAVAKTCADCHKVFRVDDNF